MFSVLVLGTMMLLISTNYLITVNANANEDYPYYKEDQNDYSNKNIEQYDNYVQDDHNNSYNNYNDHIYDSNKSYLYTCPESGIQVDNKEKCKENLVQIKNNSNESSICNIFGNIHVSNKSNITINCNINELRKSQEKQSPMLLVNKEILFCDTIANGTSNFCQVPLPMPESDRYVQECDPENALCNNINNELFKIEVTNSIAFKGSQEGTKINLDDGKKFKVIEKQENTICSESNGELECIDKEVFVSQCKDAGFDDGVIIKQMNDGNKNKNNDNNDNHYYNQISSSDSTTPTIIASCVLYEGECSGIVHGKELKECTVENYIVEIEDIQPGDILFNNVVITWRETFPGGNAEVYAAMSSDSGATFGTSFNVSDTITDSFDQKIAMSGENVVITWTDELPGNNIEVYAAMSSDSGATFGTPVNVSDTTTFSFIPQIAMSGENVVITWEEELPGNNIETFAAMSSDSGATFGTPVNVSDTTTNSFNQQIAMSGEDVVIIWQEELPGNVETFAAMSSDSGATFGTPFNVSDTTTGSFNPQISTSGENVVITWEEELPGNNFETFAAMSSDSGATFGTPVQCERYKYSI